MAAGDVSDALETRVRSLVEDNTASFTQARIMAWMQEAQMDILRRLPAEALPENWEQASGTLASDGTVALPTDLIRPIAATYGASNIPADYKDLNTFRFLEQHTYLAADASEPHWTFEDTKLKFAPGAAVAYKFDYIEKPASDISTDVDPAINARYHDALVVYAAVKCKERQTAWDEANALMAEYERLITLWGGTPQ